MSRLSLPAVFCLGLLLLAAAFGFEDAKAATYLVKPDGSGDFLNIQDALNSVVPGDIVELSDGVFTGPGNRNLVFPLDQLTLRSESGNPESCVIDCQRLGRGIYFDLGSNCGCLVERLTIANGSTTGNGGAILCENGSDPIIRECILRDNESFQGGGIASLESDPVIEDSFIHSNSATAGGGVFFWGQSSPSLLRCVIQDNEGFESGGGIGLRLHAQPNVEECLIEGNTAPSGGGVAVTNSPSVVHHLHSCTIVYNSASEGAGFRTYYSGQTFLENCILAFNQEGGAAYSGTGDIVTLLCCDVYGNAGGDYVDVIAGQNGALGNISEDPIFCNPYDDDFTLSSDSPCLGENHPECDLIGALPLGCSAELRVLYPNGGDLFCQAEPVTIRWAAPDPSGIHVKLELLRDDALVRVITQSTLNDGEYEWTAEPESGHPEGYKIRVTDLTTLEEDVSDGPFSIYEATPFVLAPNGGEVYRAERDSIEIEWEGQCPGPSVRIDLLRNDEVCLTLVEEMENTGRFVWMSSQCDGEEEGYKVRVTDLTSGVFDDSDEAFTILEPWPFGFASIEDVGNDQGRQVRLRWIRHQYDGPGDPVITGYTVYRRQDQYLYTPDHPAGDEAAAASGPGMISPASGEPEVWSRQLPGAGSDRLTRLDGWDYILTIPARGDSIYQLVAPTLCDSTADGGICWSVFFVSALTPDPFVYYDSAPDSGYSLDNLAPAPPAGLQWVPPALLAWDEAPEPDFDYFTVYGSMDDVWDDLDPVLGHTSETTFELSGQIYPHYMVTARDFAGNEGEPGLLQTPSDAPEEAGLPTQVRLRAARPNPFAGRTWIGFDLPAPSWVEVAVYSPDGRRAATLVEGSLPAGRHSMVWDGRDDEGRRLPSGIYWTRMRTADAARSQRIVLLR